MSSRVAILRVAPGSVRSDIARLVEQAGVRGALMRRPTVLKTKRTRCVPVPGANTTPWQLEGVIGALEGAQLGPLSCAERASVDNMLVNGSARTGYERVLNKYGLSAQVLDDHQEWVPWPRVDALRVYHRQFPNGTYVAQHFEGRNVVALPTLQRHPWLGIVGAMETSVWGFVRGGELLPWAELSKAMVDVLNIQRQFCAGVFAVMDVTSLLPLRSKHGALMLASDDPVALDAVGALLLGLDPMKISYIAMAHHDGLGVGDRRDIELVGDVFDGNVDAEEPPAHPLMAQLKERLPIDTVARLGKQVVNITFGQPRVRRFAHRVRDGAGWRLFEKKRFADWLEHDEWGRLFAMRYLEEEDCDADPASRA